MQHEKYACKKGVICHGGDDGIPFSGLNTATYHKYVKNMFCKKKNVQELVYEMFCLFPFLNQPPPLAHQLHVFQG